MRKWIPAILTVGFMILLHSGCSAKSTDTEEARKTEKENENVIVWQIYEGGGGLGRTFQEMWQEPLNKLLEDKSVPYDVKIEVYYDTMNDNEQLSPDQALEKLKSEDRQADVISVPTGMSGYDDKGNIYYDYSPYTEMAGKKLLEPLDDMLETEKGVKIKSALTELEPIRSQVNGVTYGISQHMPLFNAVTYRKDLLRKYGINQEALSEDIFENADILKMIRDGEGGNIVPYVTYMDALNRLGFWLIDECEAVGYHPEGMFVNAFETEELKNYLIQMKSFQDQNLMNADLKNIGEFFAMESVTDTDQIYETVYKFSKPGEEKEHKIDMVVIPDKKRMCLLPYGGDSSTGIAAWSKYPEEAFDFLTLLYTDAEIANLIQYGVEGVDYSVESGYAVYNQDNGLRNYGENFTNPLLTYPKEGMPQDKRSMVERCYEENETHLPLGFRFDTQPVQEEINAVTEIFGSPVMHTDEVYRMFCGSVDDLDAAMESFNQKLKTAGVNRIVEEANRQLAEWRKSGGGE